MKTRLNVEGLEFRWNPSGPQPIDPDNAPPVNKDPSAPPAQPAPSQPPDSPPVDEPNRPWGV